MHPRPGVTLAIAAVSSLLACGKLRFGPPPEIQRFSADATEVGSGEPVALRWQAIGAGELWLGGVRVPRDGIVVHPDKDSDYVLMARGLGGDVESAPIHVRVHESVALAVGADDAGGTQLLVRLRTAAGDPPAQDVAVRIDPPSGDTQTLECPAGRVACSMRLAEPPSGAYRASAIVEGRAVETFASPSGVAIGRASNVRAAVSGPTLRVSWNGIPAARAYHVQLVDLDVNESIGEPVIVTSASASLPLRDLPLERAGIVVEAWTSLVPGDAPLAVSRAPGLVSAGGSGGSGAAWQIFAPEDFSSGELRASFAALAPGERLAVLAVNSGGDEGAAISVTPSGASDPAPQLVAPAGATMPSFALRRQRPLDLHAELRERQDVSLLGALSAGIAPASLTGPPPTRTSFCIARGLDFDNRVRKNATLVQSTQHAAFYVDSEDLSHYPAGFFATIGSLFEDRVYLSDRLTFGAESDVDGNGKIFVVLSHELGQHLNGGWLLGYFGNDDLLRSRDDSDDCGDSGSNHADIIYLNDVANAELNGYAAADAANDLFPATIAHELQHLINLNQRCLVRSCAGAEATWINEGLSKVAEDLAGFGWNSVEGRAEGSMYLTRSAGQIRGYTGRSLTRWEGDPIGNYQGSHSFFRYFADRRGAAFARSLVDGVGGAAGVESALGEPLARAMADWATALLLSNEPAAPSQRFSYLGDGWSPLHERLRYLDWQPLPVAGATATLRADGIAVLLTGPGAGGPAEVRVRSVSGRAPYIVVVRVSGDLPQ
ncbi:MAG: hypothetical protein ACJ79G_01980 [Myxococcales bacterium]